MDAVKFVKEKERLCKYYPRCTDGCPIEALKGGPDANCETLLISHTEEYVAVVEKWSADHPIKTRASDLFEKLPKAKGNPSGVPDACAMNLGYCNSCIVYTKGSNCKECWETPMEEG